MLAAVRGLIAASQPTIDRRGLTLFGITVSNLDTRGAGRQLELPLDGPSLDALDDVLDQLRRRIAPAAVTRATCCTAGWRWRTGCFPRTATSADRALDERQLLRHGRGDHER